MRLLFSLLLVLFSLNFSSCSRPTTQARLKVSLGNILDANFTGGAVVYGLNIDTQARFSFVINPEQPEKDTIALTNGVWDFAVVAWTEANKMEGIHRCDFLTNISLDGGDQELSFNTTQDKCINNINELQLSTSYDGNQLKPVGFKNCVNFPFEPLVSATCGSSSNGSASYFRFSLLSASDSAELEIENNKLTSNCLPIGSSSLRVPLGVPGTPLLAPALVELFTDASCSSPAAVPMQILDQGLSQSNFSNSHLKMIDAIDPYFYISDNIPLANNIVVGLYTPTKSPNSDDHPYFSFIGAESGATVHLYSDNTCSTEMGNSSTSPIMTGTLVEGTYDIFVKQEISGNSSPCLATGVQYILDTTPPTTPTAPSLVTPSSPGNIATPTINVANLEFGAMVYL